METGKEGRREGEGKQWMKESAKKQRMNCAVALIYLYIPCLNNAFSMVIIVSVALN
jgi:hypothetical protein